MKEEIDQCFASALGYNMLTIGEMQALKMLVALQCLAKVGPRRSALGYCVSVLSLSYALWQPWVSASSHTPCWHLLHQAVPVAPPKHWFFWAKEGQDRGSYGISTMASMGIPSETPTEGTVINQKEKKDMA